MYNITTLPNGLRVASEFLPGLETVAVAVTVDVGARFEAESEGGISHLLEHMAFKGTTRRTARKIAEEFDDIGGNFNAYTSLEHTVYYARTLKNDLPVAVDMLGDILQHSAFAAEELTKEKQVILQEIAMHYDTPDDLVFDYFHETAYPNQPLGRSILGTEKKVSSYQRDDLQHYMQKHYTPSRMVVTAAGNIDHEALCALVTEHFTMGAGVGQKKPEAGHYVGGDLRKKKKLEQLHLMLGWNGCSVHDKDYYPLQLLATVLGGGMSSRLFQEVREKRGLAYTVQAFVSSYNDAGLLGIYLAMAEEKAGEILPVLAGEMQALTKSIADVELVRAKSQHKASLLMARESSPSVAEWIGRNLLVYGHYETAQEVAAKIDIVTNEDLARVAKNLLQQKSPTLAALGPLGKLEEYEKAKARFIGA